MAVISVFIDGLFRFISERIQPPSFELGWATRQRLGPVVSISALSWLSQPKNFALENKDLPLCLRGAWGSDRSGLPVPRS